MSTEPADSREWIDYDFAILRVVPQVHVASFVNIGVVVHSRRAGFLASRIELGEVAMWSLAERVDFELLKQFIRAYELVCEGGAEAAPLGLLPSSERFHWLTAPRSAVLQTSPVHPGRTRDLDEELERLFEEQCS